MEAASPPSSQESEFYYLGLTGLPRLVARSSTHAWEPPAIQSSPYEDPADRCRKSLWPADRNPLLHQLWNNADSSLRIQILEAVGAAASWTAIDILRVRLNGNFDTTLLVAVKPGSLTWSEAHPITLRCKKILEEHGLRNIHCEIRESVVVSLCDNAASKVESAAASDTTSQLQLSSAPVPHPETFTTDVRVDLSDYIGTKISMRDVNTRRGTKGLYLTLSPSTAAQGTPRVLALTDRHVVINPKTDLQEYRHDESQPAREVIQIDQPTYLEKLQDFQDAAIQYRDAAKEHRNFGRDDLAAVYDGVSNDCADIADKMRPYIAPASRVFGKLLYSPAFAFAPLQNEGRGHGHWLRDWALIELLPSSHQASLGALTNNVFAGQAERILMILNKNKKGWAGLPRPFPPLAMNGTMTLTNHYAPTSELLYPAEYNDYNEEPVMFVAKYGAHGELTLGLGNTLTSVVRVDDTVEGHMEGSSEEWAIISATWSMDRQMAFSKQGDSGSCVWDMKGRPAGIIMAGHSVNGLNDITYAQPLERLIKDIKAHGFDVSLI
ncbi:hypothetical protein ACHAPX_001712 [Trichoderma viride]